MTVAKQLRIFILDDNANDTRSAMKEVLKTHLLDIATSVTEAKEVYHGIYDVLLLDHDLGPMFMGLEEPNSGSTFAKWLVEHERGVESDPLIVCHSWNPDGARNMAEIFADEGYRVERMAFGEEYVKRLKLMLVDFPNDIAAYKELNDPNSTST